MLFTRSMRKIVIPRIASRDRSRVDLAVAVCIDVEGWANDIAKESIFSIIPRVLRNRLPSGGNSRPKLLSPAQFLANLTMERLQFREHSISTNAYHLPIISYHTFYLKSRLFCHMSLEYHDTAPPDNDTIPMGGIAQ